MKPRDPLDGAELVRFDERATVDAFARAAAAHFLATSSHRTYTNAEIHPHLLAIRWGVADQAVLVCQVDEAFRPLIYMDCLPDRESASQHIGDIRWSFVVGPVEKGKRLPVEEVAGEAALVVHSVLRVMMRTLGWPEDIAAAIAQRAGGKAADEVRTAFRQAEPPPEVIFESPPCRSWSVPAPLDRFTVHTGGDRYEIWEEGDDEPLFTVRVSNPASVEDAIRAYLEGQRRGEISGRIGTQHEVLRSLGAFDLIGRTA